MSDSIDNGNGFGGASADFGGSVEASGSMGGIGGGNVGGSNGLGSGDGSGGGGLGAIGGAGGAAGMMSADAPQTTVADLAMANAIASAGLAGFVGPTGFTGALAAFYEQIDLESALTGWLTVRGISDTADQNKGREHHRLAARRAAQVMDRLLPLLKLTPGRRSGNPAL